MSTLAVNTLQAQTGSTVSVLSGQTLHAPGHVVQVLHTAYGAQSNSTAAAYVDLCNIVITPKCAGSSFFLLANFSWSGKGALNLFRNSTQLHSHDTDPYIMWGMNQGSAWNSNSLRTMVTVTDYDSPTYTLGNSVTYHVKYRSRGTSGADAAGINEKTSGSTMSNFTVMEIAQ